MSVMTLTEFNQNPSRVVRLVEADAHAVIQVTKRGVPLFQVTGIEPDQDRLDQLIAAGLATAPERPSSAPVEFDHDEVPAGLDLVAELGRDRNRLG